jgi:hypothetical protein
MKIIVSIFCLTLALLAQDWTFTDQAAMQSWQQGSSEWSLKANILGYWAFDETSTNSGAAADYGSGTWYVFGTSIGATATGKYGNGWTNSNTIGVLTNATASQLPADGEARALIWWRYRSIPGTQAASNYDENGASPGKGPLELNEDGTWEFNYSTNAGGAFTTWSPASATYNSDAWELYMVGIEEVAGGNDKLYSSYNGGAVESTTITSGGGELALDSSVPWVLFGVLNGTTAASSQKTIDEVIITDRIPTDAEMDDIYNNNVKTLLGL